MARGSSSHSSNFQEHKLTVSDSAAGAAPQDQAPVDMAAHDLAVKVAVNIRPLIGIEVDSRCKEIVTAVRGQPQVFVASENRCFTFDAVYGGGGPHLSLLFPNLIQPLVDGLFDGYNATVFAYGQTGSGKTFTMGTDYSARTSSVPGVTSRVMDAIFSQMQQREDSARFQIRVSLIEIHKDDIRDLLETSASSLPPPPSFPSTSSSPPCGSKSPSPFSSLSLSPSPSSSSSSSKPSVAIRELPSGVTLVGVSEQVVNSRDEMQMCLEHGLLFRATGSHNLNARSSRSHAIFTIFVDQWRRASSLEEDEEHLMAKMHLVDLAGSERIKRTKAEGLRMQEGIHINRGLLALGNVISALGDEKKRREGGHVPYRDSKLTRLLQDSLGGNSRTVMIACVSPSDSNLDETLNTLKYANRARNIQNKPTVNRLGEVSDEEVRKLRQYIVTLQSELSRLSLDNLEAHQADELAVLRQRVTWLELSNAKLREGLADARDALAIEAQKAAEGEATAAALREELAESERRVTKLKSEATMLRDISKSDPSRRIDFILQQVAEMEKERNIMAEELDRTKLKDAQRRVERLRGGGREEESGGSEGVQKLQQAWENERNKAEQSERWLEAMKSEMEMMREALRQQEKRHEEREQQLKDELRDAKAMARGGVEKLAEAHAKGVELATIYAAAQESAVAEARKAREAELSIAHLNASLSVSQESEKLGMAVRLATVEAELRLAKEAAGREESRAAEAKEIERQLRADVQRAQDDARKAAQRLVEAQDELRGELRRAAELSEQNGKMKMELVMLQEKVRGRSEVAEGMSSELMAERSRSEQQAAEMKRQQEEMERLKEEIKEMRVEVERSREEEKKSRGQLAEAWAAVEEEEKRAQQAEQRIKQLDEEMREKQLEVAEAMEMVHSAQEENERELGRLRQANEELHCQVLQSQEQSLEILKTKGEEAREMEREKEAEIADLKRRLQEAAETMKKLELDKEWAESVASQEKDVVSKLEVEIDQQRKELERMIRENESSSRAFRGIEERLMVARDRVGPAAAEQPLESSVDLLVEEMERVRGEWERERREKMSMMDEVAAAHGLRRRVEELEDLNLRLMEDLASKEIMEGAFKEMESTVQQLEGHLGEVRTAAEEAEERVEEKRQELKERQQQLEAAEREKVAAVEELTHVQVAVRSEVMRGIEMEKRIKELHTCMGEMKKSLKEEEDRRAELESQRSMLLEALLSASSLSLSTHHQKNIIAMFPSLKAASFAQPLLSSSMPPPSLSSSSRRDSQRASSPSTPRKSSATSSSNGNANSQSSQEHVSNSVPASIVGASSTLARFYSLSESSSSSSRKLSDSDTTGLSSSHTAESPTKGLHFFRSRSSSSSSGSHRSQSPTPPLPSAATPASPRASKAGKSPAPGSRAETKAATSPTQTNNQPTAATTSPTLSARPAPYRLPAPSLLLPRAATAVSQESTSAPPSSSRSSSSSATQQRASQSPMRRLELSSLGQIDEAPELEERGVVIAPMMTSSARNASPRHASPLPSSRQSPRSTSIGVMNPNANSSRVWGSSALGLHGPSLSDQKHLSSPRKPQSPLAGPVLEAEKAAAAREKVAWEPYAFDLGTAVSMKKSKSIPMRS